MANIIEVILKAKDQASGELEKAGQRIKKVNTDLIAAGATFGAISAAAGLSLKSWVDAAAKQEMAEYTLAAAMKNAGTYTQEALEHNLKYAQSLQAVTMYGDETILGIQRMLTNFGIEGQMLDELTAATLDLAAAKEMDLRSAADLVAKSVGSSTNALTRYGITIEGAVGSTERAQMAVQNIAKVFGGSAKAQAETFTGMLTQLWNIVGDVKELLGGGGLMGSLKALIAMLIRGANWVRTFLEEHKWLAETISTVVGWIAGSAGLIAAVAGLIALAGPMAAAWAVMTGPIGIWSFAIMGAIMLGWKFRREIAEAFLKAADVVLGAIESLLEGVGWLLNKLGVNWLDGAIEAMGRAREKMKQWDDEIDVAQEKAKKAADAANNDLAPALNNVANAGERAKDFWTEVVAAVEKLAEKDLADKIAETANLMWEPVRPELEGPRETRPGVTAPAFYEMDLTGAEAVTEGMERWDEFYTRIGQAQEELAAGFSGTWDNLSNTVGRSFSAMIFAGQNMATALKAAFVDFAAQAVAEVAKVIAKMLLLFALRKALGFFWEGGGEVPKTYQHGGLVTGPSGPDQVPAYLTAGELIIPKQLVDFLRAALRTPAPALSYATGGVERHEHYHMNLLDTATLRYAVRHGDFRREMDRARGY